MDLLQTIGTDAALLVFSAAGLLATAVAIIVDTQGQRAKLAGETVRVKA